MTTPNDKFKIFDTAPFIEMSTSLSSESFKVIILGSRNSLTVPSVPSVPPVNPAITILQYDIDPLIFPFDGASFFWSGVTWTLDNTLPPFSWTASPTQLIQQEQENAPHLTSVTIGTLVTTISTAAFNGCTNLTSITIPATVNTIGNNAFNGCSGLTSINISNSVSWISPYAFNACSGLTSITIPSSVTSINDSVFVRCTNLTSVIIPNSVDTIHTNAFRFCSSLRSVIIPSSVTSIRNNAFIDSALENVTINNNQIRNVSNQLIPSPALNVNFFGRTVNTSLPS